jgi:S-DNA-T family DNA segregation ATPase FtsK/SpoIIIE
VGTTLVKRPARIMPPTPDREPIAIADPPQRQQSAPGVAGIGMILMPLMSGGTFLTMAITNANRPLFAMAGLLFLVASVTMGAIVIVGQRVGPRKRMREARERYLDYVEELRHQLRDTIGEQKAGAAWRHPEPGSLIDLCRSPARRWERRLTDPDFLVLRFGLGDQPVAQQLTMASDAGPLNDFDPVCLESARQLVARYGVLHDQPRCVDLREIGTLTVVGDLATGQALARAMLAQLVGFHAPDDVRLAVVRHQRQAEAWEWVKWLQHGHHPSVTDGDLPARMVTTSVAAMVDLLASEIEDRLDARQRRRGQRTVAQQHLVVLIDGEHLGATAGLALADASVELADLGIHVIMLLANRHEEPDHVDVRVTVAADGTATLDDGAACRIDSVEPWLVRALARQLAPLRLLPEENGHAPSHTVGLSDVLGVRDVATLTPAQTWQPRPLRDLLRVPIGVGMDGRPVMLDLKESAHGGMGPHGLIVGATGSGKSETLRTLVSSLVISHPPQRLALMLVDFKGGATFAPMVGLPHVAGMITNLEDDLTLVDRMRDALSGEMRRRQEILKGAGNLPNVTAYHALGGQQRADEPLPHLLVIIDEFSELLAARPDFAELFVAIGRIGRSIGVHLLLATQRLDMGRIRGLESHLSYRISLRTFSDSESRDAIGVPDAYHLPPEPGLGFLKVDTSVFERFKAALVSAPYEPPAETAQHAAPVVPYLAINGIGEWLAAPRVPIEAAPSGSPPAGSPRSPSELSATAVTRTTLDVIVERLTAAGAAPVRPVWLDPLPDVVPLDRVQDSVPAAAGGTITAVLGLVDDPARQRQFPMEWDFAGAGGNLLVVGAPQSGKTMLLRTLVSSMALRYPPGAVAFYCIDYGGGGLAPLEQLPQVAGVAARADTDRIRRTISEIAGAIDAREAIFSRLGLHSAADLRQARASGRVPPDVPGDIFLVIDGWGSFREEHDRLEMVIGELAGRGLTYGVHVILSVTQTMQVRLRMQPAFGGRVELRLNDAFDSAFDRKAQERIAKDQPGRGLIEGGLQFHAAVPRVDGVAGTHDLAAAQRDLAAAAARRWPDAGVPRVQVLPKLYPHRDMPPAGTDQPGVPIGLSEQDLAVASVDLLGSDPHLLVLGDNQTGKTNLLRVLLRGYSERYRPEELGIVLVDHRRTLLDVVPPEHLVAYGTAAPQTAGIADEVASSLAKRLPGPDVTSDQLRSRSWWTGFEVLFVVDDYDLVATRTANPLLPLVDLLAQGRDIGFHLVLARRVGGMSRALLEPVLQRLGDLSAPGMLFGGDPREGRLVNGVPAQRLPPGRVLYAARGGATVQIQVAWLPPDEEDPASHMPASSAPSRNRR